MSSTNLNPMHHEAPMPTMAMTFVLSTSTPLLWASWRPRSAGEYAATCIFLIVFATWTRVLMAVRHILGRASWGRGSSHQVYHQHKAGGEEDNDRHVHDHCTGPGSSNSKRTLAKPVKSFWAGKVILMGLRDYWADTPLSLRFARAIFDMVIAGHTYLV